MADATKENGPINDLNLAVIGNCSYGGLINRNGRLVWACLPHFQDDPVFCSLLNGGNDDDDIDNKFGFFDIVLEGQTRSEQQYIHNTAVVVTKLFDGNGGGLEIIDFAPRFKRLGRTFRPMMMVRLLRPLSGYPCIRIRLRPAYGYGASKPLTTRGSNHIRYVLPDQTIRCTTDAPISYILQEVAFVLEEPVTILVGHDESLTSPLAETGREFLEQTIDFWHEWSRILSIPFEWQKAVIRAAITLKLCSFDESGAIIAALTTSIPEAPHSERNWDYRFCWLRDSYFVVQALNRLGATSTMERYLNYITNIVVDAEDDLLQPVYGITLEKDLTEETVKSLPGYRGMGPVRKGNQAFEHIQNDVYGSVILAVTQVFFDERLTRPGDANLFKLMERVGRKCLELYDQPDAGLWEFRTLAKVHTHSSVVCWAGADRLAKIAERIGKDENAAFWRKKADAMHAHIIDNAFNSELNTFVECWGGHDVDGSLLLMLELGFVSPSDPRFANTVEAIGAKLRHGDHLKRYVSEDDFGRPEVAFNICTFWYIDALAAIGKREEACKLFNNMINCRNHVGLLSEDINPDTGELWGNFPQTYSMVGIINSAMQLSKSWKDAF